MESRTPSGLRQRPKPAPPCTPDGPTARAPQRSTPKASSRRRPHRRLRPKLVVSHPRGTWIPKTPDWTTPSITSPRSGRRHRLADAHVRPESNCVPVSPGQSGASRDTQSSATPPDSPKTDPINHPDVGFQDHPTRGEGSTLESTRPAHAHPAAASSSARTTARTATDAAHLRA